MDEKTKNALQWILGILKKHSIPYQITGGFAAKLYGSSRSLNDIDIDVPDASIQLILQDIRPYLTYGPSHFNDGKWDMELATLNYNGQEIDIGRIDTLQISNKARTEWMSYPSDISRKVKLTVEGIEVWVMHPRALANYKKELDGEHQAIDIAAAETYADEHGL